MRLDEHLIELRTAKGIGLREAAAEMGISASSLSQYENGKAIPRHDVLVTLAGYYGVKSSELRRLAKQSKSEPSNPPAHDHECTWIPQMCIRASAGDGLEVQSEDVDRWIAFGADWLRARGIQPESCAAIKVQGDSMEPEICDGDLVFVDRANVAVTPREGVFMFRHLNDVYVKRLRIQPKVGIVVKSVNPSYESYVIGQDDRDDFQVIGRVFCVTKAML